MFGKKKSAADQNASDAAVSAEKAGEPTALETYQVVYRGGHPDLPKPKAGGIRLLVTPKEFVFEPTTGSRKFWPRLSVPYERVSDVSIVARQVSTFEGIAGGLNSRQLNQDNNIHLAYTEPDGTGRLLRFEMLTGVTVMGQARKCTEFEDRLRNLGIRDQFATADSGASPEPSSDIPGQIAQLAKLRDQGVLTQDEFDVKKKDLLDRL